MTIQLLPPDYDERIREAVRSFWRARQSPGAGTQGGTHYPAFPEFQGASYARRYQLLAERLVKEQLYGAAALMLSNSEAGAQRGDFSELSVATSHRTLFAEFAARVAAAAVEGPIA